MAFDVRLHQSCFILWYNSPGVTQSKVTLHKATSAKTPETNYLYLHYSSGKSTFNNDNLLLSNGSKIKKEVQRYGSNVYRPYKNNMYTRDSRDFIHFLCHLHILGQTSHIPVICLCTHKANGNLIQQKHKWSLPTHTCTPSLNDQKGWDEGSPLITPLFMAPAYTKAVWNSHNGLLCFLLLFQGFLPTDLWNRKLISLLSLWDAACTFIKVSGVMQRLE